MATGAWQFCRVQTVDGYHLHIVQGAPIVASEQLLHFVAAQ